MANQNEFDSIQPMSGAQTSQAASSQSSGAAPQPSSGATPQSEFDSVQPLSSAGGSTSTQQPVTVQPGDTLSSVYRRAQAAGQDSVQDNGRTITKPPVNLATTVGLVGGLDTLGSALDYLGIGSAAKAAAQPAEAAMQQVGTGIIDQYGNEIFRDVPIEAKQQAANIIQNPTVQKAIKTVLRSSITQAGIKYFVPGSVSGLAGYGAEKIAPHIMHWLMSE